VGKLVFKQAAEHIQIGSQMFCRSSISFLRVIQAPAYKGKTPVMPQHLKRKKEKDGRTTPKTTDRITPKTVAGNEAKWWPGSH